nr:PREDICTED: F-box protein CPR30-like [Daucus carota subsp. sativus]
MSKLLSSHSDAYTTSLSTSSNGSPHRTQMLNVTPYLTDDLLSQILDRLPVKTLLQCRCVCKPWCSLIDSPRFVKLHLKRSAECNKNRSVVIRGFYAYLADFDSLEDNSTAVIIDEPLRSVLRGTGLVGSCNGLLCLYQQKMDIFIWNPAMRKCKQLPTAPADFVCPFSVDPFFLRGFGYDAVNDDYKVLRILHPDGREAGSKVIVYSLKSDSWKRLPDISYPYQIVRDLGMFLGGALHWIAVTTLGVEICLIILAFDLGVENYKEIPLPNLRFKKSNKLNLCTFADSLCVLLLEADIRIDVWLMNNYGDGNSWCKLFSLEHTQLVSPSLSVRPLAFSKSRRDVLVEVSDKKVIWYNLDRKNLRTVKIANMPAVFHDMEVYTESLVPPDYFLSCNGKQPEEEKKQKRQQKRNERYFCMEELIYSHGG